jgi:predicted outer membrane repeat protein
VVLALATAAITLGMHGFGPWSAPVNVGSIPGTSGNLNTAALEGCPFVAQRGDVLYFASNREDGIDLDIYASHRTADGDWGDPVYFTEVNTSADEFCPMAHRNGKTFLFISNRAGGEGGADIYATRLHATKGWATPTNLGPPINSSGDEFSPSLTDTELYFSSTRSGGLGGGDIYVSPFDGATFGAPVLAPGLNSAVNDFRPNVRRDGLEIFFDSNREGGSGGLDIWTSTRTKTSDPWSAPTNLSDINSIANDLRASLSWNGATLYFGSFRAGGQGSMDLYVTTR